jgi:hypothetical protein
MTGLIEALEQLEYWLWQNHPGLAGSIVPGLTTEEVDDLLGELPSQVTQEIREFYQWTNGSGIFLTPCHFDEPLRIMPLKTAIQYTSESNSFLEQRINIPKLVMFWESERWLHLAICGETEANPILVITDDDFTRLAYSSLTSMVLTNLECYQKEIIKIEIRDSWIRLKLDDEPSRKEFNAIRNRNNQAFELASFQERHNLEVIPI